jgi:hypothetical protein
MRAHLGQIPQSACSGKQQRLQACWNLRASVNQRLPGHSNDSLSRSASGSLQ